MPPKRKLDIMCKLRDYFESNDYTASTIQNINQNDTVIINASKHCFGVSSVSRRYRLMKFIKRNESLLLKKSSVDRRTETKHSYMETLVSVIIEMKLDLSDLQVSYYKKDSVYGLLARHILQEDNICNRNRLKSYFLKYKEKISKSLKNYCKYGKFIENTSTAPVPNN